MKGEAELGGVGEMDKKKKKDMNEGEKKKKYSGFLEQIERV